MNIIEILSTEKYVSGEDIASKMKISRAAVHKHINALRKKGYKINGQKNLGYIIVKRPDIIDTKKLQKLIGTKYKVDFLTETGSTQTLAKEAALKGNKNRIIIAEQQSSGYGRLSRKWSSLKGGIWFSVLEKPEIIPEQALLITFLWSIAIQRTIKNLFQIETYIKWPNDIVFEGRKLCGILTEMSAQIGNVSWLVVGIGLNANNEISKDLKNTAISLKQMKKMTINRTQLISAMISEYENVKKVFYNNGFNSFLDEYNEKLYLAKKNVEIISGNEKIEGKVDGINEEGYLLIKTNTDETKKIIAGDVKLSERQENELQ